MKTMDKVRKGGSWVLDEADASDLFTPEKMSEEHRLMAQTTDEFIASEVLPHTERLETKDWALARTMVHRCGELGLLGINVPEAYGGIDLDKASAVVVVERIARSASFATTYGAQANLWADFGVLVGAAAIGIVGAAALLGKLVR